ncbi:polyprenyl synthetase family protein [Kibdelosporangium persicum]|uniref:Geranylgeranyl diphosphate synthase type I n=1 Tax=Kibdelosporangium persicum TaxID=2698649 RepID=A0ABX2FJP7_9PSEU|nr:polyprenyl synthetase family protein [Kibdelosporangium persicum]NRN70950.1 Geranylgeranyl diphosphate synthase type I [Kibdelosporangium persicum]
MHSVEAHGAATAEPDGASYRETISAGLAERWPENGELLGSICHYALVPAGKLFRSTLLIESALAVGGDPRVVYPAALGAESGHVASLIHDDIIDGDNVRRGRPSVQHKYGVDNAIVAGDALIFDLFAGLAECQRTGATDSRVVWALRVVAECGIDLCRGQSMEAEIRDRQDFELDSYLTMARLKTAALFRAACGCGAILAGGDPSSVDSLNTYAVDFGTAFQIHDDVLAYTASAVSTGKPDTSDVRNGRITFPVALAYQSAMGRQRRAIRSMLSEGGDEAERKAVMTEIFAETGALEQAATSAREYADSAIKALHELPHTPSRDRLTEFAELAISRDH